MNIILFKRWLSQIAKANFWNFPHECSWIQYGIFGKIFYIDSKILLTCQKKKNLILQKYKNNIFLDFHMMNYIWIGKDGFKMKETRWEDIKK